MFESRQDAKKFMEKTLKSKFEENKISGKYTDQEITKQSIEETRKYLSGTGKSEAEINGIMSNQNYFSDPIIPSRSNKALDVYSDNYLKELQKNSKVNNKAPDKSIRDNGPSGNNNPVVNPINSSNNNNNNMINIVSSNGDVGNVQDNLDLLKNNQNEIEITNNALDNQHNAIGDELDEDITIEVKANKPNK